MVKRHLLPQIKVIKSKCVGNIEDPSSSYTGKLVTCHVDHLMVCFHSCGNWNFLSAMEQHLCPFTAG